MKQISWKSKKSTKSAKFVALEKGALQYPMKIAVYVAYVVYIIQFSLMLFVYV